MFTEIEERDIEELTKEELIDGYRSEIGNKEELPESVIGIVNGVYPVMILGKNGWTTPVFEEAKSSEIGRAYIDNVYRNENQFEANFQLSFMECSAEFSIPVSVVEKLMERSDNNTKENVIFNIEIPYLTDKGRKEFVSLEVFLEGFNKGDYTNKQVSFFDL